MPKMRQLDVLSLLFVCVALAVLLGWYAYPYRPIPTDDLKFVRYLWTPFDWAILKGQIKPAILASLSLIQVLARPFTDNAFQILLIHSLVSSAATAFLIALIVLRFCNRVSLALGAVLLFMTSAWQANYLFWYSYAPFTAFCTALSLWLLTESYFSESRTLPWLISATIATFLCALCAPSVAILLCCLLAAPYFLFWNRVPLKVLAAMQFVLGTLFYMLSKRLGILTGWISHLEGNAYPNGHHSQALELLGFIPQPPSFSFYRLLGYYSPVALAFSVGIVAFGIIAWARRSRFLSSSYNNRHGRFILFLLAILLVHSALLDISSYTKLGRIQFLLFPVFVLFVVTAFCLVRERFRNLRWLGTVFLLASVCHGAILIKDIRNSKQQTPEFLAKNYEGYRFITLHEDLHSQQLHPWLHDLVIERMSLHEFTDLMQAGETNIALLLGPSGDKSGITISESINWFRDFHPDRISGLENLLPDKKFQLPYFSQLPSFLFEEEVCQALYFRGDVPPPATAANSIQLWIFSKERNLVGKLAADEKLPRF